MSDPDQTPHPTMPCALRPRALFASMIAVTAIGSAQDWTQRVHERWPNGALDKATEAQFDAWIAGRTTAEKEAATRAFLGAQWAAHGLAGNAPRMTFLSPNRTVEVFASPTDGGVLEAPEPNGDPSAVGGGTPTLVGCGDQGEGQVFPYGDRDWWQVDVATPQSIVAWTGAGIGANPIADTVLELYDQNGLLLTANDDDPQRGHYSALLHEAGPGRYFVAVRGYADVRVGTYSVDIACTPPGSVGNRDIQEGPEPNDTSASATLLDCGRIGHGSLAPGPDSDWWSFALVAPTTIALETAPDLGWPSRDTVLFLRDAGGAQLAFNDDFNGTYSRIQMQLGPGVYFGDVQGYAGANPGTYSLALTCGNARGVRASFETFPGGCRGSVGVPSLSARVYEMPILGTSLAVEIDDAPPGAQTFPFFGFSTTATGSGLALPLDLVNLGAPTCAMEVDPASIGDIVADPAGHAIWYVFVPFDPDLLGTRVHFQAFISDPAANLAGTIATNRATGVIGNRL